MVNVNCDNAFYYEKFMNHLALQAMLYPQCLIANYTRSAQITMVKKDNESKNITENVLNLCVRLFQFV